jgi:hypothetical protein
MLPVLFHLGRQVCCSVRESFSDRLPEHRAQIQSDKLGFGNKLHLVLLVIHR